MPAIAATSMLSRLKTVGVWVLKIALAALFVLTAWAKLYGVPPMVEIFEKVGLGQWFRYFTGVLELLGAPLLLWPGTAAFGALLLTVVCIGAFLRNSSSSMRMRSTPFALAAILAAIVWTYRDQLRALVGPEP